MKVKELIEQLQKHNPEHLVLMSKDAEGNAIKDFSEATEEMSYEDGYEYCTRHPEDVAEDGEEYIPNCITLWPI